MARLRLVMDMFLLQPSHHRAVGVSLEVMPGANSICGHERRCVAL